MIIAVDFDGTIVEDNYPQIGKERPFATATLKQLTQDGHKLVLWSVRRGDELNEAVEWCRKRGVIFYAVNQDFDGDEPELSPNYSRKIKAHLFIDDRNVGGLPDWGVIYQLITRRISLKEYLMQVLQGSEGEDKKKRRWWKR